MTRWLLLMPLFSIFGCASTPEPPFNRLAQAESFEVRRYQPRLIAQTTVDGSYDDAANIGFRRLADYIFGNNSTSASIEMTAPVGVAAAAPPSKGSSIAMTTPVTITPGTPTNTGALSNPGITTAGSYVITFFMPQEYTRDTLPKPNNPQVVIEELPPQTFAVIRFSGTTDGQIVEAKTSELRSFIQASRLVPLGAAGAVPVLARYDPPWTLPAFRRNEVMIQIQDPGSDFKLPAETAGR